MQDRSPPARQNFLRRTAGPYIRSNDTEQFGADADQFLLLPKEVSNREPVAKDEKGQKGDLDDRHDHVRLNFGGNLATAMLVRDCGFGAIGCRLQLSSVSGLDFVAKRGSLTIGHGRNARGGCAALFELLSR